MSFSFLNNSAKIIQKEVTYFIYSELIQELFKQAKYNEKILIYLNGYTNENSIQINEVINEKENILQIRTGFDNHLMAINTNHISCISVEYSL